MTIDSQSPLIKPRNVSIAVALLLIGAAVSFVFSLITFVTKAVHHEYVDQLDNLTLQIALMVILSVALLLIPLYFIQQINNGKKWARSLLLVFTCIGVLFFAFDLATGVRLAFLNGPASAVQTMCDVLAILLLYTKTSSEWYESLSGNGIVVSQLPLNKGYNVFYIVATVVLLQGILFRIMHYKGGFIMLMIGGVLSLVYIVIALREIYNSSKITKGDKMTWTAFFILSGMPTGFFYLFKRKNIV